MSQPSHEAVTAEHQPSHQTAAPPKRKFPWAVVLVIASIGLKVAKFEHRQDVQRQQAQQEQVQAAQTSHTSMTNPKK